MFQKKQKTVEKTKVVPKPQEIEEMDEFEDAVVEEQRPKKNDTSTEDPVEEETEEGLTEEVVSNSLLNHEERLRRIEHHLRLDF